MRSSALLLSAATAALAMTLAGSARADIPPSPDSPDAHCTLAEQCKSGVFCPYAFNPGNEAETAKVGVDCRSGAEAKGLEQRCRDGNNYSGQHLYCPPGETGTWSAPGSKPTPEPAKPEPPKTEAAKTGACSIGGATDGALLALLGLLFAGRRRRR
jgi:MYXO-CTERM domain-containing protein